MFPQTVNSSAGLAALRPAPSRPYVSPRPATPYSIASVKASDPPGVAGPPGVALGPPDALAAGGFVGGGGTDGGPGGSYRAHDATRSAAMLSTATTGRTAMPA